MVPSNLSPLSLEMCAYILWQGAEKSGPVAYIGVKGVLILVFQSMAIQV